MHDRFGSPAPLAAGRAPVRRLALGALAAALVAGAATIVTAQEGAPAPIGSSGLRTDTDADLGETLRPEPRNRLKPPFAASRDTSPYAPFSRGAEDKTDRPDDADDPDDAATDAPDAPAKPSRRIDLFDDPDAGRSVRENLGTDPAAPAGTLSGAPRTRPAPAAAPLPGTAGAGRAGLLGSGVTLPSAPVRSSRTELVGGRLNLPASPLRGSFPIAADDPFAPIGLRLGSFILAAALEQSVGASTNLDRTARGEGGVFSDTGLSANLASDWSRHQLEVNALANYRRNFGGETPSEPDVTLDGALRLDVDRLTVANLRAGLVYRRESADDLDPLVPSRERADLLNYSAGADLERQFGHAFLRASASAVRETTSDEGKAADLPGEDFDTYTGAVRAGYRLSPAIAPFTEASIGRRLFDDKTDRIGRKRNSTIEALRGGLAFDFGEKLTGEVALGYAWNLPDAAGFETLSSPTVDAKVAWSPRRGTDLALTASTIFDPDALGVSTATLYQVGLAARHRATARTDLTAALTAGYRDSDLASDTQRTFGASAGFTYWISRALAVTGLVSHDNVDRLHAPGDYEVNAVKVGLRFQN